MAVTRDDVLHIADLARLAVDETKVAELVVQLNGILAHMEVLQRIDTKGASATVDVGDAGAHLREDRGPPTPSQRAREQFAPEMRDGFFIVPRLATHDRADGDAA